ncbi:hypothetical protein BJF90_07355 [Pseudonocardia sp. CNS-004]|nr:hypothetical protein BJF90_07355 [Pseudonocardia sp. CNS-004]
MEFLFLGDDRVAEAAPDLSPERPIELGCWARSSTSFLSGALRSTSCSVSVTGLLPIASSGR